MQKQPGDSRETKNGVAATQNVESQDNFALRNWEQICALPRNPFIKSLFFSRSEVLHERGIARAKSS
jgi:hypothetical protein